MQDKKSYLEEESSQGQYLLFLVGGVMYAIEALSAKEIVEYSGITKVPKINTSVKGVTNIRGNIVPVIDLLERFSIGTTAIGEKTSIIVVHIGEHEESMEIGILIDEVYEVDNIEASDLKKAPEFGSKVDPKFILCMGKYDEKYIAILNTKTILDIDELSQLVE
ncbi:MAG: chemotaxis protein CheW [Sulfurimonas sp.]|nr:chemotaxis protein CheW [Sulfurimonas sp.]